MQVCHRRFTEAYRAYLDVEDLSLIAAQQLVGNGDQVVLMQRQVTQPSLDDPHTSFSLDELGGNWYKQMHGIRDLAKDSLEIAERYNSFHT